MFWVYILENPAGKFYVGQTNDLERRITEDNLSINRTVGTLFAFQKQRLLIYYRPSLPEIVQC
jgi:predicted GIY-YIG superfamily endonuclease